MRLLHSETLKLEEFNDLTRIPYAILSHTWGEGEVSFQEMQFGEGCKKAGYSKIQGCCKAALADGLEHVWTDTCCIDKTSSSELSETINSMYESYQSAEVCYVYLADVFPHISTSSFAKSRWFRRGWTLQELIAPSSVIFFDSRWRDIGTKASLVKPIAEITGIQVDALKDVRVSRFSVAQRMSWASRRETTRLEDIANCLLGIFSIDIPLLYGEGQKAFLRLQEEIMKTSDDHSIFAWTLPESISPWRKTELYPWKGFRAQTPLAIAEACSIVRSKRADTLPFTTTNRGIHLQLPLKAWQTWVGLSSTIFLAALYCKYEKSHEREEELLAIWLYKNSDGRYSRCHTEEQWVGRYYDELPTISFEEIQKLDKVSLYTTDDENLPDLSFPGEEYPQYSRFELDTTGIDIKHASFSNALYHSRVQHHNDGTFLPQSPVFFPFGILEFNLQDKSGDRFFVALGSGTRDTIRAAFVDTIHAKETTTEVFNSLMQIYAGASPIYGSGMTPSYDRYCNRPLSSRIESIGNTLETRCL